MHSIATGADESRQDEYFQSARARTIYLLFFFSGFPALIYQLVWQRALFRILGVNIESVTIVVTAFMLGLGIGSLVGGYLSRITRVPLLLLLAAIEILTAIFGAFSLWIFEFVGDQVLSQPAFVIAFTALALVLVPTLLMGATLPVLAGHLIRHSGYSGRSVGMLYSVNTFGAGFACLFCIVAVFPFVGMLESTLFAAALNAAVAIGAVAAYRVQSNIDRRRPAASADAPAPEELPATGGERLSPARILLLSFVGGFVALSYEIFFFRSISFASGNSSVAFAATLGVFLLGLAMGAKDSGEACHSLSAGQLVRKVTRSLLIACAIVAIYLPLLNHLDWLDGGLLLVALILVLLFARFWGMLLPCLAQLGFTNRESGGMQTAQLYLVNIAGSVCGSLTTGYFLMNQFGLIGIAQILLLTAIGGTLLFVYSASAIYRIRASRQVAGLVVGLSAFMLQPVTAATILEVLHFKLFADWYMPYAKVVENRSGIITVDRDRVVFGHGMYDGVFKIAPIDGGADVTRPYALSLVHAAPKDVLMIGMGSGSWAQIVANNPHVETLTIVEINPGYAQLIAEEPLVASVLDNPKVRLIHDDGRRWLKKQSAARFDAVIANATWHFRANATNLLSVDFLALVKSRLRPGGILFYNTTGSSRVLRTGCTVFPSGARFLNFMLASNGPIDWNFERWKRTLEGYTIDGKRMFDPEVGAHRTTLAKWMQLESDLATSGPVESDKVERCDEILQRTQDTRLITDNNMGTEWRYYWGSE